ncbi:MAG TPA: HEAT repeat domain-containing protein [Spirochaetota bacterium]|nr:HEAT repeat domain-containing protein [Spirochaetota bacterium]HPI89037.1 HEAT repeat domain-containing protein [Spirochaetota bacterium]HPR48670.1 HEAT repeat domain-containing protein [Spirochaetota bacterium]
MKKLIALILVFTAVTAIAYADTEKKSKSTEEYIADLSQDKDENVIIEAADWAGEKKNKDAIDRLAGLINDERENVRLHAVMALGYIGDEKGVDAVNSSLLNDESADVRYAALLASFRIGSKKSLDTWKQAKEKETDPFIQDFLKKAEEQAMKKK